MKGIRIAILHGCNLNMLGQRDPGQYGTLTLKQLEDEIAREAAKRGWQCVFFQTNHEGELVEKLQKLREGVDGLIINPGAWTHYSYAIRDALEMVRAPVIEVHLSDISSREEWRRHSVISDVCAHTISGKGPGGYSEALSCLEEELEAKGR